MTLWRFRALYLATFIAIFYVGRLPPDSLYPHTHLRDTLVYGMVSFSPSASLCTMIQHHWFGEAALTTPDGVRRCFKIGAGVGSVVAMYNMRHDVAMDWD
ncbi:hypothetical protein B0T14DRAFT_559364 [Immersiella caudata]|uniref:Uncharacterized protein n=1 Tax=Immersiella caudata TaxID=314043 RepID=A0AA40CBL8_9PEZI|nr:hypothetical protein B0T14DRAFT_559364 [Immersiella caudata]